MSKLSVRRGAVLSILALTALLIVVDLVVILRKSQEPTVYALPVVESSVFVQQHEKAEEFVPVMTAPVNTPEEMATWKDLNVPEPDGEPYTVVQPEVNVVEAKPEVVVEPAPVPVPEPIVRHKGEPAKIIVIIDDMGMDKRRSKAIADLSGPLTLAYLPYASGLETMTKEAVSHGHELIIHMPMEPMDKNTNPGPIALRSGMSDAQLDEQLDKAFASFTGYVGINNHMGSKLTKDTAAMRHVMARLKERDLLFVDSKTIGSSVASRVAAQAGLKYADRDVFLDNTNTVESVNHNLRVLERVADKRGYAIAIGHPRDGTIGALKAWLPTLKERGFELVPVSRVVHRVKAKAEALSVETITEEKPAPVIAQEVLTPEKIEPASEAESSQAEKLISAPTSSEQIYFLPVPAQAPLPVTRPAPY